MVVTLSKHPALLIRDILIDNWDRNNVLGYDPTVDEDDEYFVPIGRGWYDLNAPDPQITLTNFEEGVIEGGISGYSGMQGDGSGPNQDRDGFGLLTVHARDTGNKDYQDEYAEGIVWLLEQECERILQANSNPDNELRNVSATLDAMEADTDASPTRHYAQASVGYDYLKEPDS